MVEENSELRPSEFQAMRDLKKPSPQEMSISVAGRIFELESEISRKEDEYNKKSEALDLFGESIEGMRDQVKMLTVIKNILETGAVNLDDLLNERHIFLSKFHDN